MSRDDSPLVRETSPDEGYTYMHRAFFHAFLTRSVMTADEVKPILASVMTAHSESSQLALDSYSRSFVLIKIETVLLPLINLLTLRRSRTSLDGWRRYGSACNQYYTNHQRQNITLRLRDPVHERPTYKTHPLRPCKQDVRRPHTTCHQVFRRRNCLHTSITGLYVRNKQYAHTRSHGNPALASITSRATTREQAIADQRRRRRRRNTK